MLMFIILSGEHRSKVYFVGVNQSFISVIDPHPRKICCESPHHFYYCGATRVVYLQQWFRFVCEGLRL